MNRTMRFIFGLLVVALCLPAIGQVVPAATGGTTTVSASTEAVAFHYNGNWSVGNLNTQSFDIIDWGAQKGNSFSAEAAELLAPTPGINSYLGFGKYTPDISSFISKTNLSADQFQVFVRVGGGETTMGGNSYGTMVAGGGATWSAIPNLNLSMGDVYWIRFNGVNSIYASAGLRYIFNPNASPSFAMKRMLARQARKAAAVAGR
jgi:hypothetical protein